MSFANDVPRSLRGSLHRVYCVHNLFAMRKLLLATGAALVMVGGGCAGGGEESDSWGMSVPGFTLPADGSITVATKGVRNDPGKSLVSAEELYTMAEECGYARDVSYYTDIESLYIGVYKQEYTFTIAGDYEMPTWTVTVMPNRPGYTSLESFKQDFDVCSAGGDMYPEALSSGTLMFVSSCGSGYSGGKENGCEIIRAAIEPTLTID